MRSLPEDKTANVPHARPSERPSRPGESTSLMPNPSFSRRAFIRGGLVAGALTFLGSIVSPGGTVVNAYADETGTTHFSIYVLGKDEVPVMAMRQTAAGNVAVGGVKVTITSLYNQKQVSVTTGDDGFAPVHIRDLSFQCEERDADSYAFYGSVTAQADGYRDVHFVKEYLESAVPAAEDGSRPNVLEIPMEVDDGSSYLLNVSMDDVDILHCSVPVQVGDYNDIEHAVSIEVARGASATSADVPVSLIVDDAVWATATAVPDAGDPSVSKATFSDYYLSKIAPGQKLRLRFEAPGEKTKTVTMPFEFENGIHFAQATNGKKLKFVPGITLGEQAESDELFGMAWFFGESDSFSFGLPGLPVEFFSDVSGNFGFAFSILSWQFYKSADGQKSTDPNKFKWCAGKIGTKAMDNWWTNTMEYASENISQAYEIAKDNHGFGVSNFSRKISISFEFSLRGTAKCEYVDKEAMRGDVKGSGYIGANIRFAIDVAMGWQFALLYIPVYVNIDISGSAQFRPGFVMSFKNWLEEPQWDTFGVGFVGVVCAQVGVSVGVGVRGVIGVGVRVYGSGTLSINAAKTNNPTVILAAAAECGFQMFVQLFFLYKSFMICHPARKSVDNKSNSFSAATDAAKLTVDPSSMDLSDAKMMPQIALEAMSEFGSSPVEASLNDVAVLGAGTDRTPADGVTTAADETFERSRAEVKKLFRSPLIMPGPAHAQGFATPYGALNDEGEILLGASGTSDLAATGTQDDFSTVKTYNPRLGLVPVEQEVLYDQVFSNSHLRTFVGSTVYNDAPEKNTVMARLVTVTIPDNAGRTWTRSRVYVRLWNAETHAFGEEQVVSFKVDGVDAKDRFDVDYDIDVVEFSGKVLLAMAITSVKLVGDETIGADAASDRQFLTFVVWNATDKRLSWSKSLYSLLADANKSTYSPRTLVQGPADDVLGCFYYQQKDVDTGIYEGIYTSPIFIVDASPMYPAAQDNALLICDGNADGTNTAPGSFEVATVSREGKYRPTTGLTLSVVVAQLVADGSVTVNAVAYDMQQSCYNRDTLCLTGVADITPLGTQETSTLFTYTYDSKTPVEKKSRVVKCDSDQTRLFDEETSGYTSDSSIFASADGKRLYTVRLNEGTDHRLDEDSLAAIDAGAHLFSSDHYVAETGANYGGASTTSDVREPVYQLLESRWIESLGAFHEFYPIARLSFAPDNACVLSCAGGKRDFVVASLTGLPEMEDVATDAELNVKSDIYHVSVPDVVAIQCEGVAVESKFAAAGDTVAYAVEVVNTGNCLINGFTVTIRDGSGNVVDEKVCNDLREYLQESMDNHRPVRDENGEAVCGEDGNIVTEFVEDIRDTSGILWPGFLRKYRFTFTMPEGYEGETSFSVQVSDPRSNPYANAFTAGEVLQAGRLSMPSHLSWLEPEDFAEPVFGASLQSICDPRRMPFTVEQKAVSEAVATSFSAVPAVYQTDDQIDGGGHEEKNNQGGGSNGSGAGGKKGAGSIPKTGDTSATATAAALAAAAVTAGVAGVAATRDER